MEIYGKILVNYQILLQLFDQLLPRNNIQFQWRSVLLHWSRFIREQGHSRSMSGGLDTRLEAWKYLALSKSKNSVPYKKKAKNSDSN